MTCNFYPLPGKDILTAARAQNNADVSQNRAGRA